MADKYISKQEKCLAQIETPPLTKDQRMTLLGNKGAIVRWVEQHKAEGIALPAITAILMKAIEVYENHLA
jgi:hypothetical protein